MSQPGRERHAVAVSCLALIGSIAGATLGAVVAEALGFEPFVPALACTIFGIALGCTLARRWLADRLPIVLDGWFTRRRRLRWLWIVVAVLAIANTARIGLFAMDPAQRWASAFPLVPESGEHQCFSAYVRAGELAGEGLDDLWVDADYGQGRRTQIDGLAPYMGDPYEYPPTFAVLPRAAVAATHNYQLIRDVWFGISGVGFLVAFIALAVFAGGRAGKRALLLTPVVALSFPFMFNLQWGQAHLLVVAAAVLAMIQFARDRTLSGSALLAFAIATKIFPALLLVHLAVRRQWRAIIATLAMLAAMTALAAFVFGMGPLRSFVSEHLPRMASGEAFSYTETNFDNHSLYGLAFKLAALGVGTNARALGGVFAWVWSVVALALTMVGSRGQADRPRNAVLWLGILCLATLRSPFAPAYTAIASLWLLSIGVGSRRWPIALVAIAWFFLQGTLPLGSPAATAIASLPSQLVSIAIAVISTLPGRTRELES